MGRSLRIVVIGDDPASRQHLREALAGYEVLEVGPSVGSMCTLVPPPRSNHR